MTSGCAWSPAPGAAPVSASSHKARVQNDLEGTYNACFEAGGQKNCTYKP